MAHKITVIIVDDIEATRDSLKRLLQFEENIEVVGEASTGSESLTVAEKTQPDIILMDINMPEMNGIRATELLSERVPNSEVIIMSVQEDKEYLRKAMNAGARDYLIKPFTGDDLAVAIVRTFELKKPVTQSAPAYMVENNKFVTFFSTKGGVGKTTIATNVAVALAQSKKAKVLLIDLDLQFGDNAVFLNLIPKRTIAEIGQIASLKDEDIKACITIHESGLDLLAAPMKPEYAEMVTVDAIKQIIAYAKKHYDFVIVDTKNRFEEISLLALDEADEILLVVSLDLPTLKNAKLSLELMSSLGYTNKIKIVLNRAGTDVGMEEKDIKTSLGVAPAFKVLSDGKAVVGSLNSGTVLVTNNPQSRASEGMLDIAKAIRGIVEEAETPKKKSWFPFIK